MKKIFILLIFVFYASSQIKIISEKKLNISENIIFARPIFSNNGKFLFFTDENFNGIWKYDLIENNIENITSDSGSGYQFAISDDNQFISYRKTFFLNKIRFQEIIEIDLINKNKKIITNGENLQTPKYFSNELFIFGFNKLQKSNNIEILGIQNGSIFLNVNGISKTLNSIKNGNFIWASLSPNKKYILSYEVDSGTMITDLNGNIVSKLGRKDAPIWLNNDWIIFMDDKDDGEKLISSDLNIISFDGKKDINLTNTKNINELFPSINYQTKQIACSTDKGEILLYRYEFIK